MNTPADFGFDLSPAYIRIPEPDKRVIATLRGVILGSQLIRAVQVNIGPYWCFEPRLAYNHPVGSKVPETLSNFSPRPGGSQAGSPL
jgi:hypothetical protein